ncbi:hypothetical protein BE15_44630 [Sorangium cellulosum]|uniref:Uncharacterized protein n=2 Tax=Sorangium cellulosum TaxID=56 RepID=A0A150QTL8_SORCE|nr:hypothetical protein BE15_44630 [Sorangium cellulosum]
MHVTLGSLALLALASGCGGERRPAQPVTGTPTFESEVPQDEAPYDADEQPPGAAPRRAPPGPGGEFGRGPADEGRTGERGARGGVDEHALCEQLAAATSVSAEDIPGGVQIVLTPSPGASATSLDTLARQLDAHLGAIGQAGQEPPSDVGTRCRLFDMARTGARGRVVEAADGLRVRFTSPDPEEVSILREQARQFEQSAREGQVR